MGCTLNTQAKGKFAHLISEPTGKWSLNKTMYLVANIIVSWIMVILTLRDKMSWEYMAIYLFTVGGYTQLSKFLTAKTLTAQAVIAQTNTKAEGQD